MIFHACHIGLHYQCSHRSHLGSKHWEVCTCSCHRRELLAGALFCLLLAIIVSGAFGVFIATGGLK